MLDDMRKKMEEAALDRYFIVLKDENKVIGMIGTNRWSQQGMEVGYCVNINYWGKGYATEALKAFLEMFWNLPGKLSPYRKADSEGANKKLQIGRKFPNWSPRFTLIMLQVEMF